MNKHEQLRQQLKNAQAAVSAARNDRAAKARAMDQARDSLARVDVSPAKMTATNEYKTATAAQSALRAAESELESLVEAENGLLSMLGERSRAAHGPNGPIADGERGGLARVARELDRGGHSSVEVPALDMLAAGFNVTPSEGLTAPAIVVPFMPKAQPRQFLFTKFAAGEVEDGQLALTEYRQTGSRTVTGTVLRDPVSVAEKAKVELSVALETPSLKQLAIVVKEIPNQLFASVPMFEEWLLNELVYQLQLGAEAHCLAQIAAATPPHDLEGATLIEQIRFGVRKMKEAGATPSVVALSPADAEALDVQKTELGYIFATRDSGSASPIYGCEIVEVAGLAHPILVDPTIAGVMYLGLSRTIADPYSGNDHNITKIVSEANGLMHVRDTAGLFVLQE